MTLYYPQLPAGSVVQFPYRRRMRARTVVCEQPDGSAWTQFDDLGGSTEWLLRYSSLSEEERTVLEGFFDECEGRLKGFTFFDPNGNLLRWSEDLTADVWQRSGALSLSASEGPFGGPAAQRIENNGGPAAVSQAAGVPGRFRTCFSLYLRSDERIAARIFNESGGEARDRVVQVEPEWRRVSLAWSGGGAGDTQAVGLEVPAGARVDVYGAQLEAQPGMSAYRKSSGQSGIYEKARFASDWLVTVADAPGLYSVDVRVIAF